MVADESAARNSAAMAFPVARPPMLAIPSPDLLVNLFASGVQVLGLLAVAVGGSWFKKNQDEPEETAKRGSPWPFRIALLLLVGVSVAFGLYVLKTQDATNTRLQANLIRKSVEGGKKVGDTSLKTLGFSDQHKHPRAISSEQLAAWLAAGEPLNLIDVREPEEIEVGQIAGTWARRFPDLKLDRSGLTKAGHKTILLCDSGNRSSELVDLFTKDGVECWFMIGGYEKWVAEYRPLLNAGSRTAIRDIPDYPRKHVLLDTPEVERLVREEGAVFVDVRYPEEFAKGALPGAINLTLRKMLQHEIEPQLRALPRRPIIVPCYDKRSSFFGMLLGLRLHRLGGDFHGRYTVPHEYIVPSAVPAHLAAWEADQQKTTVFSLASGAAAAQIDSAGRGLGSLMLAVLLVVVLVRLLLLPFTLKAERDQVVLRAMKPQIEAIRARHPGDPARVRREIFGLHRAAGLSPVRNLLGSLLVLVIFLVLYSAVDTAASGYKTPFLWLDGLGLPDAWHVLPIAVGGLFLAMLLVLAEKITRNQLLFRGALAALITAAVWSASAAALGYLLVSIGSMLLQRGLFLAWWQRQEARRRGVPPARASKVGPDRPVLRLADVEHVPAAGRKARRLSHLIRAGFPVPDGFVVLDHAGIQHAAGRKAILRAFSRLRAARVAVRSSGTAEDGEMLSHAGEFSSHLMITREGLLDSIAAVEASLRAPHSQDAARQDQGGVLVQAMVPAEHAGVLFTEDPVCSGAVLVEMTKGLGDGLVSGQVDPDPFRFGKLSHRPLQEQAAPIDLQPLLELGRRAEKLFGRPQDIEWAYSGGRFHLLQSRDITCRVSEQGADADPAAMREAERARLLAMIPADQKPEDPILVQNELSELLPEPTPLSLALMNDLWGKDGSVERAATRLGIPYAVSESSPPYAVSVFGRLYVNRNEGARRFGRAVGAVASFRLTRSADALERAYRQGFLPRFQREVRLREAVDPTRFEFDELITAFVDARDHFVRKTYVEAEVVNLAATFYANAARVRLNRAGHSPAELLGAIAPTILPRLVARFRVCGEEGLTASLAEFGHRAPHDFELAEPRYVEALDEARRLVARARAGAETQRDPATPSRPLGRLDQIAVTTANKFEALKEEAKHEVLREFACLRALVLEIGRRLDLGDGVFWLLPDEIAAAKVSELAALRRLVAQRRAAHAAAMAIALPAELGLPQLETIASSFAYRVQPEAGSTDATALRGLRVAGAGDVFGRVRVLRDAAAMETFEDGDVLVARFTDPRWLPLFGRARGIVTEVGGWLSHAAIQAREHRLPAVVGVRGVMDRLNDGDLVCMRADGTVEKVADRRHRQRLDTRETVYIRAAEATIVGSVVDISDLGMRVDQIDGEVRVGDSVELTIGDAFVPATVVHRHDRSVGLRLRMPLPRAARARIEAG